MTIPDNPDWFLAAYKDWSVDPFGGGWNFWSPLVDVEEVMTRMRQPLARRARPKPPRLVRGERPLPE